jgi:hypothetical protein
MKRPHTTERATTGMPLSAILFGALLLVPSVMAQSVDSLTLINATTDLPVPGYDPISTGATINTTLLGNTNFNVRANTTPGTGIGSVVFALSGATTRNQNENAAPYALFGDTSGNYSNGAFNNGLHILRATPWSGASGTGTAGTFHEIQFTVTNAAAPVLPTANAGPDRMIVLPVNSTTLNGSGTDDAPIASYAWTQIGGPTTATLGGQQTASLAVSDLIEGAYSFRLTVTDQDNNTATDDASVTVLPAGAASVAVAGELRKWHRITLVGSGPATSETATPNPFSDYRIDMTFSHPGSGKSYRVPGFYATDGDAAESSADSGNQWFTHFAPDETGAWNYSVSFRTGPDVAVSNDPNAGVSAGFFDGASGTFYILATDKNTPDLRAKGRLQYVGAHHLRFAETGEWFMKCGTDSPENLLAYDDFDATPNVSNRRKSWSPHAGDYQASAMASFTWQGGKGSELLGAIGYLASEGLNAVSFLTFSLDGDDDNVFPQRLVGTPAAYQAVADNQRWNDTVVHKDRFDVSKLAQWDRILSYAGTRGIYLHFKTQETENDQKMDGGALGRERILYYRELIARYGQHLALNWNIGEENTNTDAQRKSFAQWFHDNDPYRHHTVIHTYPDQKNAVYTPLLGASSKYSGVSLQINKPNVFADTLSWRNQSAATPRPWVVANDEQGSAGEGIKADVNDAAHDAERGDVLWGNIMAGGAGIESYFGYQQPESDLTCQDFRARNIWWDQNRHALSFFAEHNVPFQSLANADTLVSGSGNNANHCLAMTGSHYVVYLRDGGSHTLDLTGASGPFQVRWFDPRNGGIMQTGSVASVTGGGIVALGNPPAEPAQDWIVHVSPAPDQSRVLFIRGADRSGGFLEASNDTQRTEQLSDIFNTSTASGNHGWNTFRITLENAGYTVGQITETADTPSGASAGIAIDFTTFDLDSWDVLVFGSNNATYSAASVDAVETWIRKRGGAALFISDANFGGSWNDAPDSDQPFLNRFGLIVNQDEGTYSLLRSSGDFTAPTHPVLTNVNQFDGEGVSPYVLNVLPTHPGTTLTKLAVAKSNTRNNNGTNPGNNFQGNSRPVTANDASLVAIESGYGRVVGHFDRNTFFNINGAGTNITRFDNAPFAVNLINWLSGQLDPISPWEGYAQTHFALLPGGRANPSAAFTADADGNGLPNGIEYLLGSVPTDPSDGPSQAPRMTNLVFSFLAANPIPPDLTVVIQGSMFLDEWTNLATHSPAGSWAGPVSVTPEGTKLRVTLNDSGGFRFFRLTAIPGA